MSRNPRVVYLHGFRSSPKSFKARLIADRMAQLGRGADFVCPQLPPSPLEAVALVREAVAPTAQDTLVGSSLGGFYATWLAERLGSRAVLLNPAIRPARDLRGYTGPLTMYHSDERFDFRTGHIEEMRTLEVRGISFAQRYFLIAAKGDELLDWREMVAHYPGARHKVLEHGDHGLSDFADYVDEVLEFANVIRKPQRKE
jgi:predicted esterase YcpF (UPF0227 family)